MHVLFQDSTKLNIDTNFIIKNLILNCAFQKIIFVFKYTYNTINNFLFHYLLFTKYIIMLGQMLINSLIIL
jgi:hypothetical protein